MGSSPGPSQPPHSTLTSGAGIAPLSPSVWHTSITDAPRSVSARISGEGGMPSDEAAADFLGFVATLLYEGAEPARARQWVVENVSSGGKLTIGNANFELSSEERARVLRIVSTQSREAGS